MTPNFMDKTAKIIAEVRGRTCIDDLDAKILEEILQDALNKYCRELDGYYDAGHAAGFDEGYTLGYDDGHSVGHSEGHSAV